MRIAIDHQVTSLQDAGGMSRYHYELARHMRGRDDVEIDLLLGAQNSVLPFQRLAGGGVRVLATRTRLRPGSLRYARNSAWTHFVAPLRGRYDICHATYQRWEPAIRSRALVATHHDATQERFPHLFRNAAAIRARKERIYRRADLVVCVSASAQRDLLDLFAIPEERTRVIHHGVSLASADAALLSELRGQPSFLLYVGSRSSYKNFSHLLASLALLAPDVQPRLLVAGGGPWSPEERLELERLQLAERVGLFPRVTDEQLAALYESAMLLVYPSLYEGFGLPPLEAMTAGCPVLVSRTSSLPEVCGAAAHYFAPHEKGSLTAALGELLADETLRRSKLAEGREWAARYTWKAAAEATLAAYGDALFIGGRSSK